MPKHRALLLQSTRNATGWAACNAMIMRGSEKARSCPKGLAGIDRMRGSSDLAVKTAAEAPGGRMLHVGMSQQGRL